ncbi:hypothetical protein YC2023_073227 [Brassica napus]
MSEPKVPVRFDLDDHEHEPKEKSLEEREGLKTVEGEVEVLTGKRERLNFKHVVDQIASVSVHQPQVDVVVAYSAFTSPSEITVQPLVTKQKNRSHFYEYSPSKSSESSEMLEVVWTTEV